MFLGGHKASLVITDGFIGYRVKSSIGRDVTLQTYTTTFDISVHTHYVEVKR